MPTPLASVTQVARHSVFPATLLAALLASLGALERGVSPPLVVLGIYALLIAWVATLERLLPCRPEWNRSQGDLAADALYLPTTFGMGALVQPGVAALAVVVAGWLSASLGTGLWPHQWPLLAQVALACVVAEFFDYGAHRALHASPALWRVHRIHHSAPRLYWLNATRTHPAESLFRSVLGSLPLAVLGAPLAVLAVWGVLGRVAGLFQHANVDFALGPFSWLFSIGSLHHWHHSANKRQADCNYGNTFIFWDTLFGTRYDPAGAGPPAALGIEGMESFPRSLAKQLLAPWTWRGVAQPPSGS